MDFTTRYCGPYWSDGKFQKSVDDGRPALSKLDDACRRHDAAYKNYKTQKDLEVADTKFYNETKNLGLRGRLYGGAVLYGNNLIRKIMGPAPSRDLSRHPGLRGHTTVRVQDATNATTDDPLGGVSTYVFDPYGGATLESDPGSVHPGVRVPKPEPGVTHTPVEPFDIDNLRSQLVRPSTKNLFASNITPLYRPLKKKPMKKPKVRFSSPPETKQKSKKSTKLLKHAKVTPQHVDQASCRHEEIRRCYNYRYCPRCNREFH